MRPLCPLRAREWLPGSATEACRVGVAQTPLRGSARSPGACHRLPCSPRSMSVPPRSRRSARPPRSSAPLRAPPAAAAQSPPRALAPPSREPVPGVTDHLTATCALRHVGAGGRRRAGVLKVGKGQGGAEKGRKGDSEAGQAAASRWRLHFARKFVKLKVSSQASGLATAPFSAPVHLLERKTLFARWNESFG